MNNLIEKMRRAREQNVTIGGHVFTVRRPLVMEQIIADKMTRTDALYALKRCVVGWSGVTEADLVAGGGSDEVPFSADLWDEWLMDHPEVWEELSTVIRNAVEADDKRREADSGN